AGLDHRLQAEAVGPGDQPRPHEPDAQHGTQTTLPVVERDVLLAAGDRNLAAVLRHLARTTPGGVLDDDGRLVLVSTSPTWPGPYSNGALRLDSSLPPEEVLTRAGA